MLINFNLFNEKKILVTGHTGFIGSWLSKWLTMLNAQVCGFALEPPSIPNMYEILKLDKEIVDIRGDIRNRELLQKTIANFGPEIVFHLAAQPLVLESYNDPVETFDTNVTGTVNLLNTLRNVDTVRAIIVVTSDKSYHNNEWAYPYREIDMLGGKDPYSASKSCQDIVVNSFKESYFSDSDIGISSVRAGNVIGGGDWAEKRIIPDLVKGVVTGKPVKIRHPNAVRPWQHVMEPISGMLTLAGKLYADIKYSGAWNFGPDNLQQKTVSELAEKFIEHWGKGKYEIENSSRFKESNNLQLDISKAKKELAWRPIYGFDNAIKNTVMWYKAYYLREDVKALTTTQISLYMEDI